MKKIKFFDLMERSFLSLKKANKKMWIIGVIIAIFSGGLIVDGGLGEDTYTDDMFVVGELRDENGDIVIEKTGLMLEENLFLENLSIFISALIIFFVIFIIILTVMSLLIYIGTYYLYHITLESLFDANLERASLGLVVKVNLIVTLKTVLGLMLFIIPGIIIAVKYAPANYILCKHPELSSKEIMAKSREFSKGFKWKIFLYETILTIISGIILFICVPSSFVNNSSLIYILSMAISLGLTTFISVYSGIFNIHLFKDIEYFKEEISI
ncbi:MAG: DUF975 family protein [Peptostreptococcaceae bacterium]